MNSVLLVSTQLQMTGLRGKPLGKPSEAKAPPFLLFCTRYLFPPQGHVQATEVSGFFQVSRGAPVTFQNGISDL